MLIVATTFSFLRSFALFGIPPAFGAWLLGNRWVLVDTWYWRGVDLTRRVLTRAYIYLAI